MKIISLFNNKGGAGKSTLAFHLGCALGTLGKKVLMVDLDPQCNLTISGMFEEDLHEIWKVEDDYIEDFETAVNQHGTDLIFSPRSIHFLLKPTEDGLNELTQYPPVVPLFENVDLIPGRLSLHKYENKLAERWSGLYQSDNLSIRTVTNIRRICEEYARQYNYDYVLIDTSPSLGILNKIIISTVDGFIIPALPDMFSTYGIRNIGSSLQQWQREFNTIYQLISRDKRSRFPQKFVQFMGYTIYNAKKQSKKPNNNSRFCCEIQVRTLFEEIWGEIDHSINYPHPTDSVACREQLRVLSKFISAGTRLTDSIFRSYNDHTKRLT